MLTWVESVADVYVHANTGDVKLIRLLLTPHGGWLTIDMYTLARGEGNAGMYVHQAHARKLVDVHTRC